MQNKKTVVLGMSGGVDSSVALYLLKEQGFNVVGVSLKFGFWKNKENELKENVCCSKESINRAKKVCDKYGVPHFVVDTSKEFKKAVIDYFLKTLKENRTPSPCLFCNRDAKIAGLLKFAKSKKADFVATGHYAKIKKNGEIKLLKAKDKQKDQTYFLALLKQEQLAKLIFPLGDYTKAEVYEIAKKQGIEHFPKESQDLCFVSGKSMPKFLEKEVGINPGKIIDIKGKVLGNHKGLHFYTIGQRKGIKLPGGPFWVNGFNGNDVLVSKNEKDLFKKQVLLSDLNFLIKKPKKSIQIEAKIRYRQELSKAVLQRTRGSSTGGSPTSPRWATSPRWELVFNELQRAVTPGQIAVFYKGNVCLGGGVINN